MKKSVLAILLFLLCSTTTAIAQHACGTAQVLRNLLEQRNGSPIKELVSKPTLALTSSDACTIEDYYDEILTQTSEHLQIFYTLDGPHKATQEYIDSLSKHLEYAWNFHVKKTGMLPPLGISKSFHYQQDVFPGLYPVEVLDIDLIRDSKSLFGANGACHGCYGLTIPFDSTQSTLIIDNDFRCTPRSNATKASVHYNGKECFYEEATQDLTNSAHGYSYSTEWNQGLRVTAAHELYHAIQLRFLDFQKLYKIPFWFEASAMGIEEVVAPDVDDYFNYLSKFSNSIGISFDNLSEDYGPGLFFMYLYKFVDKGFDKSIWESFSSEPSKPFQHHLAKYTKKHKLSADSLFHSFAVKLSFTGSRAPLVDSNFWINNDQPRWPEFKTVEQAGDFEPYSLNELSYRFYSNGKPDLSKFTGKSSAVSISDNRYSLRFLPNTNSVDSVYIESTSSSADSIIWILSRFTEVDPIPTVFKDSTLRAFPTPWRHGHLCFTPLPQDKEYIEIRNRRGNLVEKIKYDNYTLCLDESKVKSLMVPGVYRFRAGNSGKLKDFIVIY